MNLPETVTIKRCSIFVGKYHVCNLTRHVINESHERYIFEFNWREFLRAEPETPFPGIDTDLQLYKYVFDELPPFIRDYVPKEGSEEYRRFLNDTCLQEYDPWRYMLLNTNKLIAGCYKVGTYKKFDYTRYEVEDKLVMTLKAQTFQYDVLQLFERIRESRSAVPEEIIHTYKNGEKFIGFHLSGPLWVTEQGLSWEYYNDWYDTPAKLIPVTTVSKYSLQSCREALDDGSKYFDFITEYLESVLE